MNRKMRFIREVLNQAEKIEIFHWRDPQKCFEEIKRLRADIKACERGLRDTEFLPCGHQDAAGDALDEACRDLTIYIAAMHVVRGRTNRQLREALEEAAA